MSLGLGQKFNILQQSPHDLLPPGKHQLEEQSGKAHWVPSRYNVRAITEDGRLILWNSYRRTFSVFNAQQRSAIEAMLSKKGFRADLRGMVKYLFDRGYLLKEGTDEYRRIQLAFGHQQYRTDTLQLMLLASEDCNFRCQYCYEEFARGTMLPEVRTGIKNLVRSRLPVLKNLSISWFGGEPLYGFQAIEDLAPFFVQVAEEHSLYFTSGMTTNGYLLTPDTVDKLLSWKTNRYQITIDGSPENHDESRPTRDGQGTFSTIFRNLQAMRGRPEDFEVDIRVNWDRRNLPGLKEFLNVVEQEFSSDRRFKIRFRPVFKTGGPNDELLDTCGVDETREIQSELEREARKRGLKIAEDIRQAGPVGSGVCYAARPYHFVIGASGQVMKCTIELDMKDRNIVGQITESGDLQLDQDKMALWCEPAFEKDTKCQKCVILPVCMGSSCPLIRFEQDTSPCVPLRRNVKYELRETLENTEDGGRRVLVSSAQTVQRPAE
jgi:uncharacterized protein